jgi:hypothetical protein
VEDFVNVNNGVRADKDFINIESGIKEKRIERERKKKVDADFIDGDDIDFKTVRKRKCQQSIIHHEKMKKKR